MVTKFGRKNPWLKCRPNALLGSNVIQGQPGTTRCQIVQKCPMATKFVRKNPYAKCSAMLESKVIQKSARVNQGSLSCSGMPCGYQIWYRKNSWPKCSAMLGSNVMQGSTRGQIAYKCPIAAKCGWCCFRADDAYRCSSTGLQQFILDVQKCKHGKCLLPYLKTLVLRRWVATTPKQFSPGSQNVQQRGKTAPGNFKFSFFWRKKNRTYHRVIAIWSKPIWSNTLKQRSTLISMI